MVIGILWSTKILFTFALTLGYDDLSVNKTATQKDIASTCAHCVAQLAVDRNINTCMRTEAIGKTSQQHTTWWNVDLGGTQSIYNINIQFKKDTNNMIQRGRFAGFSLFVSNTTQRQNESFLCYKNRQGIPTLDFNTICTKHGRYVIFYNERLVGTAYPREYQNNSVFTELCEVTVKGCSKFGVFGENCNKPCPENCQERRCDIISGKCLGCLPGWRGDTCKKECTAGYYGLECTSKCVGHCKDNKQCNHINGTCEDGCKDGYTGSDCTEECPFPKYGQDCLYNCSGNCQDGIRCNLSTGRCDNGCEAGFTGKGCDKDCASGTFGKNCRGLCSGNCKDNITCDSRSGYCYNSCVAGFLGDYCNRKCEDGKYGQNCTQNCSTYCIGGLCNNVDGSCYCSQENNWHPECKKHCPTGLYGLDCRSNCSQGCKKEACERENGYCTLGCKTSLEGPMCTIKAMLKIEDNTEKSSAEFIGAGVGGIIGIIILVLVGIFFLRRKKRKASNERTDTISFSTLANKRRYYNTNINTMIDEEIEDTESKSVTSQSPKKLDNLIRTLADFKDTQMEREYKAIPKGELHPCVTGKRKENQSKNRYTTIFPYDHSRVVLDTSTHESDYINANYIEDVFKGKSYIATQGPKTGTTEDYWRMVWQENARILICLTNISEAKTKKCAKYWPDLNEKLFEGDISVRCQKEQIYAENIFRQLRIQNKTDQTERDVYMFHYTQWPDHGVPEPLSLVVFHRHVMKTAAKHPMGYIVVNCSAGVGRTGTFIALDALYREGEKTGTVNVPQYVEKMRNARMNMVQGEDQYKILYMALLEAFRGRLRAVPVDKFLKEFQNLSKKSQLAREFEELLSIRKVYTQEDYESGRLNMIANYCPSVLPVEKYLCQLTSTTENLYYNAVYLQSFTRSDRFISAQFPLSDYTENFLTLVKTYNAYTVVSLYPLDDVQSTFLWLPTKNQHKAVGKFTMNMTECLQTEYVARTNMTLQEKGGSKMRVAVLECKGWENEYDNKNKRVLIDLIQETKIEERTHPNGRILVLSSDGAKRCGPFCAVYNALEQMMLDGEVDLFTITRQLQTRRPEFLPSFEEYKFCHDTISDYLQNDTLYANV